MDQLSQEDIIPVSTIGISLDSGLYNDDGSNFTHIQEVPYFQTYTIDELRYYDYLKQGYISIVEPDGFQPFNHENQFQENSFDNFNDDQDNEPDTVYYEMSPWSFGFPSLQEPESLPQSQPYGVLPDTDIHFQNQFEQESLSNQQYDMYDYDFDKPHSIFSQYSNKRRPYKK